jgi:hypothetical protein
MSLTPVSSLSSPSPPDVTTPRVSDEAAQTTLVASSSASSLSSIGEAPLKPVKRKSDLSTSPIKKRKKVKHEGGNENVEEVKKDSRVACHQ